MDILTRDDVNALIEDPNDVCLSIYMPAYPKWNDNQQNPIRFKNLLNQAESQWHEMQHAQAFTDPFFVPLHEMLEDKRFWESQSYGLALFRSADTLRYFRLPVPFDEVVTVSNRFHLKPLLSYLGRDQRFYILALSQKNTRILRGTRQKMEELKPEGLPTSLQEALAFDLPQKQLQFYSGTQTGNHPDGKRAAIFHGQGAGSDDNKNAILRFFQQVSKGMQDLLRDEDAPLILAGVEYLLPIYRETNSYKHLMEEEIHGNTEEWDLKEFQEKAWELMEPRFTKDREQARARYEQVAGQQGSASEVLREIVPGAVNGRVDLLFVPEGVRQWGVFDADNNTIHVHETEEPGDIDLLDLATVHTYLKGGTVFVVPPENMPTETEAAAIFRY